MKLTLLVEEKKPGLEAWFNVHAPKINEDFRRENIFDKIYKNVPRQIRSKVPFDIILSNKDKMTILNSHSIRLVDVKGEIPGCYRYEIVMDFNQDTLDSFDVITQAINIMPLRFKQMIERQLRFDGTSLQNITKDALVRKVCKAIEEGDFGQKECVVLEKRVE